MWNHIIEHFTKSKIETQSQNKYYMSEGFSSRFLVNFYDNFYGSLWYENKVLGFIYIFH